jgi:hypothetical protein
VIGINCVVTSGTAVFMNAGMAGHAKFQFFITGANPLTNLTLAYSAVDIPTAYVSGKAYDLAIESTPTGFLFSVDGEDPVFIADLATRYFSPYFSVRNEFSAGSGSSSVGLKYFGLYQPVRYV